MPVDAYSFLVRQKRKKDISKKKIDFCKDHDIIRRKSKPVRIDNLTFSNGTYGQNGKSGFNFATFFLTM